MKLDNTNYSILNKRSMLGILKSVMLIITIIFLSNCKGQVKEVVNIQVSDLQTILNTREGIQLVDVRTPAEWEGGTIKNAIKINVTAPDFEEKALKTLSKEEPIYLYCRSGGRSLIAADILLKKGYEVYNVEGGYLKWKETIK